ncbi:MAG: protoporphyrinogen oxidase [Balneola sp.]|nr:protoporphyrinogen oxidase [Balneola sp.]
MPSIGVLGGGISGLAAAWFLKQGGAEVTLFEKETPGGAIRTELKQGLVLDLGPNSLRDKSGELLQLISELGLKDELLMISKAFKTRSIVRNSKLKFIKPSLTSLLKTDLLSLKAKLRFFAEPFQPIGKNQEESVGSFLRRRLGKEAVNYLADPILSGIYAGDIEKLSKTEILPEFARCESEYRSLFLSILFKNKIKSDSQEQAVFNFRNGLQTLPNRLAEKLSEELIHTKVTCLEFMDDHVKVTTENDIFIFDQVLSCLPAYVLSSLICEYAPDLSNHLEKIHYPAVLSTSVTYSNKDIPNNTDAFGFLVPRIEGFDLLGAIWKSSIFPSHAPEGQKQYTLLAGGAHKIIQKNEITETQNKIIQEFSRIMNINAEPIHSDHIYWEKAIPQQNLGYWKMRSAVNDFMKMHKNFTIGGNYLWGVSIPDCIKQAKLTAQQLTWSNMK